MRGRYRSFGIAAAGVAIVLHHPDGQAGLVRSARAQSPSYQGGYPAPSAGSLSLGDKLRSLVEHGRERYTDMQQEAMARLANAPHQDSCSDRQRRFAAVLPGLQQLATLSAQVYSGQADVMASRGMAQASLGTGHTAYQGSGGNWYAESVENPAGRVVILAFRGTRSSSNENVGTDIANFAGVETPYYAWALDLGAGIAARHPGWRIVATGHSLGGGLALSVALSQPNASAVVFDPAGISGRAWNNASAQDRRRVVSDSSAFVAVTPRAMDPVSAGSVTGLSVIPARIYAIPVNDGGNPVQRHRISTLEAGLQLVGEPSQACSLDAGDLGLPVD